MTTVLVVDDSLTDRKLAGGLLTRHAGWDVQYATDGRDALDQIELHVPDLVVTDLNMPELDGLELVRIIRETHPLVPVILMTNQGSEQIAVRALQTGASSYVPKNRLAVDLEDTVQQVLGIARADRAHVRLLRRLKNQQVQFEIENDQDLIATFVRYLQDALRGMGLCDDTERVRIGVALQEALINACFHGNLEVSSSLREVDHRAYYNLARERSQQLPYRDRRIFIFADLSPEEMTIVIRDEGPGFDRSLLPDPTDPANLEKPCGRGLLLMQTFMNEVRYNAVGNEVTMIKRRCESASKVQDQEDAA
ncbi:MAG: ATP-binding protein [Planctomycetaceae bacterium]|nr:ATP-binding protein [Planctomycetaceae bacterium]